ncbi:DUF6166 domain-containing protein [Aquisphaera insulae]|uniref:DUF6166 domain-containing protein n=1 Tax=Aquisphaera insulae TaxID=2712864 RepID=UPI0034E1F8C6
MARVRYEGRRTKQGVTVTRDADVGTSRPLPLRLGLARKSPAGFEWGYDGSGPARPRDARRRRRRHAGPAELPAVRIRRGREASAGRTVPPLLGCSRRVGRASVG